MASSEVVARTSPANGRSQPRCVADEGEKQESSLDELPALMDDETCLRLCEASEILYIVTEQCVAQTVEIRHRLECMTKWIRGTASQVKARGTAADSVQKENARKIEPS